MVTSTVSAPQFFKIYDPERLKLLISSPEKPNMLTIDVGLRLVEVCGQEQDVVLESDIQASPGEQVTITTQHGTEEFDALIIACPLHRILPVMDLSDDERLFTKR